MLNRRQFVGGLVGLAVLDSTGWKARAAQTPGNRRGVSLQGRVSKAVFLELVGDTFTVSSEDHTAWITLIEVEDGHPSAVAEQFSLVFQGPGDLALPEGVYTVEHRTAGRTTLFLQPGGHDGHNSYYGAAFNLLLIP